MTEHDTDNDKTRDGQTQRTPDSLEPDEPTATLKCRKIDFGVWDIDLWEHDVMVFSAYRLMREIDDEIRDRAFERGIVQIIGIDDDDVAVVHGPIEEYESLGYIWNLEEYLRKRLSGEIEWE